MKARVTLDREFVKAKTDKRLYGSFIEHMGRVLYTAEIAPRRCLSGCNAMLANETYVFLLRTAFAMIAATTPEAMMTTISTGASTIPGIPAKKNPSPKR